MQFVYHTGIPPPEPAVYHEGMTILDVRLENARKLAAQIGGQQRFAERLNMSRQQASHIIGSRPVKGIGHSMARRIEVALEMPIGWLDIDHSSPVALSADTVDVPMLNTESGAGAGVTLPPISNVVTRMQINKKWLRLNVQATAFENLSLLTAIGDSMEPTFADGSVLLVDRGVSSIKVDGVYVLFNDGDLFIKRVQRELQGGAVLKSDNPAYSDMAVNAEARAELTVLGRVLLAWNPKKL